jgi:hypothetical protein
MYLAFWVFPKYSGYTHDNSLTTQGIFVRLPLHSPTQIHANKNLNPQMNADKRRCN